MSQKSLISRHSIDSCTSQFQNWRPFQLPITADSNFHLSKPHSMDTCSGSSSSGVHKKQHYLIESKNNISSQDFPDISKLTLFDSNNGSREGLQCIYRKRRRRCSRSLSGRSSERSRTRRCCSAGASVTYATCSDIPVAGGAGTDSSGELFASGGDGNWTSDLSEVKSHRKDRDLGGSEKDVFITLVDSQGNESGYGSEPGYRGDAEFGYEDEVDEEEDDQRQLFWGDKLGDGVVEVVGENTFSEQKSHHRGRRKKQPEWKMVEPLR